MGLPLSPETGQSLGCLLPLVISQPPPNVRPDDVEDGFRVPDVEHKHGQFVAFVDGLEAVQFPESPSCRLPFSGHFQAKGLAPIRADLGTGCT